VHSIRVTHTTCISAAVSGGDLTTLGSIGGEKLAAALVTLAAQRAAHVCNWWPVSTTVVPTGTCLKLALRLLLQN
jgi:hypothetical protein